MTLRPRYTLVLGVLLLLHGGPSLAAKARRSTEGGTAPAKPDRALYQEAVKARKTLEASPSRVRQRQEWERVVMQFRRVVARYPQSAYCDDALLATGDLYRHMSQRFKAPRYNVDAAQAYRAIVAEYPSSPHGEPALFSVFEIAREGGDRKALGDAGRAYLGAFPDGKRAGDVRTAIRQAGRAQEAPIPRAPPPGLVPVYNLRFWSGDSSTRVVFDLAERVPLKHDRIAGPDRLWIDLQGTRLHPNMKDRTFPVGDGLLEQIRVAQNKDDIVRVVLDFKEVKDHTIFYLENPIRLVVDVRGALGPTVAAIGKPAPVDRTAERVAGTSMPIDIPVEPPRTVAVERPILEEAATQLPRRRVGMLTPPDPPTSSSTRRSTPPVLIEGTSPESRAASRTMPTLPSSRGANSVPSPPAPPQVNRTGSYSLARQLGLGARTIVIDAGHGGHDPGTIGRSGLQEKDLVLDVALRLAALLRNELGAEVLLTRAADVFVPLEERTAIANSKGADLFLSIHANSSRSPKARGIETYFLNFAVDPHAEEVAARENAISAATLKDLQGLVKAITLNSKIDESRDFATSVHEAMVNCLRSDYPETQDRGIRTAPFYVLIGANMPSILAEIAFLSHASEEKLLKTQGHRDLIARSLLQGVRGYLDALNRTQARLTEAARPSTVNAREGRRR